MKVRTRYLDWGLQTRRLCSRQPGTVHVEAQPGAFYVVVTRDSDGRQWNTEIASVEAARELLSGIALAFPHLLDNDGESKNG